MRKTNLMIYMPRSLPIFFAYNQVFRFSIAPFRVLYSFVSCLAGFAAIAYEGGKVYICPLLEL